MPEIGAKFGRWWTWSYSGPVSTSDRHRLMIRGLLIICVTTASQFAEFGGYLAADD